MMNVLARRRVAELLDAGQIVRRRAMDVVMDGAFWKKNEKKVFIIDFVVLKEKKMSIIYMSICIRLMMKSYDSGCMHRVRMREASKFITDFALW